MIVLDASALVELVLDQPAGPWVLERIARDEVVSPAHQPAEALSAIARLVRAGEIDPTAARGALSDIAALPQRLLPPTRQHLLRAFELGERIRVLDGLYVALAEELHCPLVTTDLRLARATPPGEIVTAPEAD